jgi:hypothetical protein
MIEVAEEMVYLGEGKFWCGGFVVKYSSRRTVDGDVNLVRNTLRGECAFLICVETELRDLERWVQGTVQGREGRDFKTGQWRDETGKGVKRELRPEMFI